MLLQKASKCFWNHSQKASIFGVQTSSFDAAVAVITAAWKFDLHFSSPPCFSEIALSAQHLFLGLRDNPTSKEKFAERLSVIGP